MALADTIRVRELFHMLEKTQNLTKNKFATEIGVSATIINKWLKNAEEIEKEKKDSKTEQTESKKKNKDNNVKDSKVKKIELKEETKNNIMFAFNLPDSIWMENLTKEDLDYILKSMFACNPIVNHDLLGRGALKVEKQGILNLGFIDNGGFKVKDIPFKFKKLLKDNHIDKDSYKEDEEKKLLREKDYKNSPQIVFTINNTRISTFVAFVDEDKKNMLIFNRESNRTFNENARNDCFGAMDFTDTTITLKINSSTFHEVEIQKVEPIFGMCYEDNGWIYNDKHRESAIMFGYIMYVKNEDLKKGISFQKDEETKEDKQVTFVESIEKLKAMSEEQKSGKLELALSMFQRKVNL